MRPAAGELGKRRRIEAGVAGGGIEIGRQRQAHPDQERAERHQRPVGDNPLAPGPRPRHPPQRVQQILDGGEQEYAGRGDADDADRGGLRRRLGEILEPPGCLLADLRHEIAENELQQLLSHRREIGERRENAEGDHAERHQRDQRRIAERTRGGKAAVAAEAMHRVSAERDRRREALAQHAGPVGGLGPV